MQTVHSANYWIDKLNLTKHPEGGYFKEIYRSAESVIGDALPQRFGGARSFGTSIYFLLKSNIQKNTYNFHAYLFETIVVVILI